MALFRKFFYRKPPDGLLEISERVYVFDYCFTTDVLEEDEYKVYIGGIVAHLREHFPDASFMVFNFREGEQQSQIASILSEFDTTVMDYPRHYEGCPLLTMEMVHHFLRSSESWLSLGQNNVLLMHCERGGWPVLAFMLAGLMIYRKQYTGEQKTLDMIYKQAPRELLQLLSPLNPLPSQLRYLQYISRRNVGSEWPPLDRALTLDCVILRVLPNFDRESGCRPIFRIYGQDPFIAADRTPKVLFSTPKKSKAVRLYKADCELVKIDIHCHIQGDVVLECISLDEDVEREEMMFRVMFNTAFIRSNILILNRDEIDILWDAKDRFPKDFRAEILLSEMDAASSIITMELTSGEEKEGLPVEAFAKVQEIFSNVDWLDPSGDAALHVLHHIASSNALQLDGLSPIELEGDAMSQISSPGVLKEILQSQEANDGREDVAFRVLQHIASSKALQEKLDALSPKEFESDDMSQKSSPSMLKEMLRSQEANDGRGDVALRVLQHIASSKTLQEKLDAWSLKEVETDALSQKSQETNARREDAAFPGLKNMASLNALQEKHDPSSQKEVESDYISEKSSPSVLKEMTQSQATDDGRTVAAHDVLQHFKIPNALQEKIDASSLKEMESDALSRKPNPLPNEILQSHESITSIEKSSPAANPSDWKAASENIELRDVAAAGHPSQPEFLIQHTESGSDPASSNNPLQSLESNDGIKNSSPTAPKQQSIPFNERSPDSNAKSQNIKLHNVGAALHSPQPRILAQRMPKSRSNPTSLNNSLQGPSVPISRYHSAPSALGITALLHDHAAFGSSEVTHSVAIPPLSLSLSSASVFGLCEPARIKTASPTPVLSSSTISTEISMIPSLSTAVTDNSATTATISSSPPPPLPPVPSSASPRTTFSIPPPPPPPFLCSPSTITTTAAATMRMVTPSPSSPRPLLLTPSPPPPPPPPPKSEPTVMLPSLAQKAAPPTSSTSASFLAWAPEQLSKPLKNLPASEPVNTTSSPHSPHYGTSSVKGLPNSVPCSPPPPSSLGTTFSVGSPRCESNTPSTSPGPTREQLSKPLKNLPASEPVDTSPSPRSPHYGNSSVKGLPNSVPCPPPPPSSLGMTFSVGSPGCESNTSPSPRSPHYGNSSVKGLPNSVPCPPPPPSSLGMTFSVGSPGCESNTPSMPPGPPREQLLKPLKNLSASEPVNTTPSPRSPHYGTSSVKGLPNSVPCPPPPPSTLGTTFSVDSPRCESNTPSMPPGTPPPPPPPPRVDPLTSYHPPSPAFVAPPPPPPPPRVAPSSPNPPSSPMKIAVAAVCVPPPPPPPPRVDPLTSYHPPSPASVAPPPPPPPPRVAPSSPNSPSSPMKIAVAVVSAPPPPPPPSHPTVTSSPVTPSAPLPPPLPNITSSTNTTSQKPSNAPPIPPPPGSLGHGGLNGASSQSTSSASKAPPPPANGMLGTSLGMKGRSSIRPNSRNTTTKRSNLKPLHWVKVTRAMSGSLWAEAQKPDEASRAPEFDMSELESLFSTAMPNSDARGSTNRSSGRSSLGQKTEKVQLIDLRRANNCEIMLTKVKMPLPDLMSSLLALDDSVLDIDQIDNLIKFCPTKEEMDLLKAFSGDKESLGKCEQYFLELMKVPRVESKLRVFSFKIQFRSQVVDLSKNLNTVNSAAGEIRNSAKLKRIMQTILSLGNALNQGTARGSAVGFRLDSLLKLTDTRARNNKMTLMHYLCKVLAEKLPELLDFSKDLVSLEVASKIQLKTLAEEMQSISKGLEKVEQELTASENDGPVSETFHKTLKEFLVGAEAEVRALTSLYSNVGRNADALALYFGEDPARCPFEQVVSTLLNFVKMFARSHEENCKQLELEKKKAQKEAKEAESEKAKLSTPKREFESLSRSSSNKNESLSRSSSNKNANIK